MYNLMKSELKKIEEIVGPEIDNTNKEEVNDQEGELGQIEDSKIMGGSNLVRFSFKMRKIKELKAA